jgi:glycolate oxidase FAD binding subunit
MSTSLVAFLANLRGRLGGALNTDPAALHAAAVLGVEPCGIISPASTEQVCDIVRAAAEQRVPVLTRGSGTEQELGHAPPAQALVLCTRHLNSAIQHEPADMIVTAPAGMTLGDLQAALQRGGQWLPLDGPSDSTLGGLLATDRHGPRSLGCGTLRDFVLGMTIVNGDGVLRKCGGKVVKNVTGYPLEKLYIGSLGTLGILTEVTFKLRPLPIERRKWTARPSSAAAALSLCREIGARGLPLESLVTRHQECASVAASDSWRVEVSATGTNVELDRIVRDLNALTAPSGVACDAATVPVEWTPDAPQAFSNRVVARFWCRSRSLDSIVQWLQPGDRIEFGPHGGTLCFAPDAKRAKKLFEIFKAEGANHRVERRAGLQIEHPFGPPRPEWALMRQIKAALDPRNILNPGRFVV